MSEDTSVDFTFYTPPPWSRNLLFRVSFQLHGENTALQSFRRIKLIVHNVISIIPGNPLHLRQVKHVLVKYLAEEHNIETMLKEEKQYIYLKILHNARQWGSFCLLLNKMMLSK